MCACIRACVCASVWTKGVLYQVQLNNLHAAAINCHSLNFLKLPSQTHPTAATYEPTETLTARRPCTHPLSHPHTLLPKGTQIVLREQ